MKNGKLIGRIFGIALVLVMGVAVSVTSPPVRAEGDVVGVQFAICLDSSGSIGEDNWTIIVNGLANAVGNSTCFPHDGSVELTVVRFSGLADVPVGPVVITSDNAASVASDIRNITFTGGGTDMSCPFYKAADVLRDDNTPPKYHDADWSFDPGIKQVINLVTDVQYTGFKIARDNCITALQMTGSQDVICAEFIGNTSYLLAYLRDNIVFPQPGCEWDGTSPTCSGWVRQVANAEQFADTICEKFQITISGITAHKFNDLNWDGYQDSGEDDLEGWAMTLYEGSDCSGNEVYSGTTDSNGNVVFTGLEAGTYSVKETLEGGWTNSTARCQHVTIAAVEPKTLNFGNVEIILDHFTCYLVEEETAPYIGKIVQLEDQFGAVTVNATVAWAELFCNPVEKVHGNMTTTILYPDHHLTLYSIDYQGEPQTGSGQVDNQFGIQDLTISGPVGLVVPTQKVEPGDHEPPVGLDHFLLYQVVEGSDVDVVVDLIDQFGNATVMVTTPRWFAIPAQKTHGGNVTEIENSEAYLVFYEIDGEYLGKQVQVANQFGEQVFNVTGPAYLVVPSEPVPYVHYDLILDSTQGGNVLIPGEGTFTYYEGTLLSLLATPDEGYQFVEWTGDVDTIANVEDAETTITMQGNYQITANFEERVVCFIATAAYGTPMAEEIQILREFRDEYLLTNPLGQAFVGLYYKVSPPIGEFITEHPSLKPIVRAGLVPAVAMSTIVVGTTSAEKMAIVGLLVLVSVAVAIWAKRRRGRDPEYL